MLARIAITFVFSGLLVLTVDGEEASRRDGWMLLAEQVNEQVNEQGLRSEQGVVAEAIKPLRFSDDGSMLFTEGQFLTVKKSSGELPKGSFSAEAWCRVDQPIRWGNVVGFLQDNGSYEKGWSLGYNQKRFEFRVADQSRIINVSADEPMSLRREHHVVGVCDTRMHQLRIYVDGLLRGTAEFGADGPIYPEPSLKTELAIGAYKDKDELYPLEGRIREIALYDGVLTEQQIRNRHQETKKTAQSAMKFDVRPGIRFLTPTSAEVRWETTVSGSAALAYGETRKLGSVIVSPSAGTSHRVVIEGLKPGVDQWLRFGIRQDGKRSFSAFYQLEGGMNYMPPVRSHQSDGGPEGIEPVLASLRQRGGYAVVIGDGIPGWCPAIAAETQMTVVAGVELEQDLRLLRQRWYEAEGYGIRLSAQLVEDVPEAFANLVVADSSKVESAARHVAPLGTLVAIGAEPASVGRVWRSVAEGIWVGRPDEVPTLAAWGHQYGTTGNASYSGEQLGGVDRTEDLEMKWIGRPGADFGIDRNPRMPAPLAVGGRLFHQGMNRMIALDAFNGAVLWSLEIPDLRRVNIPRDSSNWCADETHVFAAVNDRLWVIDAASGRMEKTLLMPEPYLTGHEWGYVAVTDDRVVGTVMKKGSAYSGFWDKASWYDGKGDAATAKVCGTAIVGYDKEYGSIEWQYDADAIVHSTITIDGDHVYFIEADDPELRKLSSGKLQNRQIWKSAKVVCLDLKTGSRVWESSAPAQDHEGIVSFGIADSGQFVLQTSGKNQFHFASFDATNGQPKWNRSVDWPEDHHGAHVQHAVLMNQRLYVQPHILDADSGEVIQSGTLGKRRGCATPIGAGNSIIYRGGTGPLSLWSLDGESKSEFARLRPSCWLSTIPAQGMLFSPEGGGGCSCGGWMETSIGFAPKRQAKISTETEVEGR